MILHYLIIYEINRYSMLIICGGMYVLSVYFVLGLRVSVFFLNCSPDSNLHWNGG